MTTPHLLVEGASDVVFFRRLLERRLGLPQVEVKSPRDFGYKDTVTQIPSVLQQVLLPDMRDGRAGAIGVVVDADHVSGGGVQERWDTLRTVLADGAFEADQEGYGLRMPRGLPGRAHLGSVFEHPDGLPPVGLWLMPDHNSNGMLEDLILQSATDEASQQALLAAAKAALPTGAKRLFGPTQLSKAQLYTWLAWQKRPGQGLQVTLDPSALGDNAGSLLDDSKEPFRGLIAWLKRIFS